MAEVDTHRLIRNNPRPEDMEGHGGLVSKTFVEGGYAFKVLALARATWEEFAPETTSCRWSIMLTSTPASNSAIPSPAGRP